MEEEVDEEELGMVAEEVVEKVDEVVDVGGGCMIVIVIVSSLSPLTESPEYDAMIRALPMLESL